MSVLGRVLPFWLLGILTAWISSSILSIRPSVILMVWVLVLLISWLPRLNSSGGIPNVSFQILLVIFLTSFQITNTKCSSGKIATDEPIQVYGQILKVWNGKNNYRAKMRVIQHRAGDFNSNSRELILLQSGNRATEIPIVGSLIVAETKLQSIAKKEDPDDFPERLYWAGEGIQKKGWMNDWKYSDSGIRNEYSPFAMAEGIQNVLCNQLDRSSIGEAQASVVKAMLLGRKDDLSAETKSVFQQTGISHLLAVSGLHVGLIYLVFIRLFFFMKRFKGIYMVEFIAVIAVWSYSLMTGFGPSVQRAAGMISLFALSRIMGRRVEPMQILVITFLFQTALDPFAIFRFGFQLSYLAVAGIFIVYGPWTRLVKKSKGILKKIWNFAGVSIAAQTFTIPFILVYFHEFPIYFILANLILVPLGLLVFYLGAAYLILLATGINISFLGGIIDLVVRLLVGMGENIANFPYSVIGVSNFTPLHLLAYYYILGVMFFVKNISVYRRVVWLIGFMLGFSVLSLIFDFLN